MFYNLLTISDFVCSRHFSELLGGVPLFFGIIVYF